MQGGGRIARREFVPRRISRNQKLICRFEEWEEEEKDEERQWQNVLDAVCTYTHYPSISPSLSLFLSLSLFSSSVSSTVINAQDRRIDFSRCGLTSVNLARVTRIIGITQSAACVCCLEIIL